jgi:hypothetical protein
MIIFNRCKRCKNTRCARHPNFLDNIKPVTGGVNWILDTKADYPVDYNESVIFNVEVPNSSDIVSYDNTTGLFTLNYDGDYLVNWYIGSYTFGSVSYVAFGIDVSEQYQVSTTVRPSANGQISGFAYLDDLKSGDTLSLINETGDPAPTTITLIDVPYQAAISIVKI